MEVRIPSPLFSYTGGRSTVDATGATLDHIAHDLERQFPGLRFRIIDEQGRIRPHIKFFINFVQADSLSDPVTASDSVAIIQAFSGG